MFINYDINTGISINSYRNPNATCGDIGDLVDGIINSENVCCDLEGAKDALCDGAYWQGSNATEEVLEFVYNAIDDYEKKHD